MWAARFFGLWCFEPRAQARCDCGETALCEKLSRRTSATFSLPLTEILHAVADKFAANTRPIPQAASLMHDMKSACTVPEVAVCVVGQLRMGAKMSVQKTMRHAWNRVGPGCVDIFLSLGLEKVEATNNHPEWPEMAYENATAMVKHLRPVEHRLSYESLPTSAGRFVEMTRAPWSGRRSSLTSWRLVAS